MDTLPYKRHLQSDDDFNFHHFISFEFLFIYLFIFFFRFVIMFCGYFQSKKKILSFSLRRLIIWYMGLLLAMEDHINSFDCYSFLFVYAYLFFPSSSSPSSSASSFIHFFLMAAYLCWTDPKQPPFRNVYRVHNCHFKWCTVPIYYYRLALFFYWIRENGNANLSHWISIIYSLQFHRFYDFIDDRDYSASIFYFVRPVFFIMVLSRDSIYCFMCLVFAFNWHLWIDRNRYTVSIFRYFLYLLLSWVISIVFNFIRCSFVCLLIFVFFFLLSIILRNC